MGGFDSSVSFDSMFSVWQARAKVKEREQMLPEKGARINSWRGHMERKEICGGTDG